MNCLVSLLMLYPIPVQALYGQVLYRSCSMVPLIQVQDGGTPRQDQGQGRRYPCSGQATLKVVHRHYPALSTCLGFDCGPTLRCGQPRVLSNQTQSNEEHKTTLDSISNTKNKNHKTIYLS